MKRVYTYRHCCSKFTKKKKKKGQWYRYHSYWYRYHPCKKRQWPFGTGTALIGTGTARRTWANLGLFWPILKPFHVPLPTPHPPPPYHIRQTLDHFSSYTGQPEIKQPHTSVSIFLIRIFLSLSPRCGKRPSFLWEHHFLWYFIVPHGFVWVAWVGGVMFLVA